MTDYYAGIGSRNTPESCLKYMTRLAEQLSLKGLILRSGGARGADTAFERGAGDLKEIYTADSDIHQDAWNTVHQFHPRPNSLSYHVRKLMARNAMQIFGPQMDTPVKFVLCWTPDAADGVNILTSSSTGGTGQAIRIAAHAGVPVFNLRSRVTLLNLSEKIQESL